MFFLVLGDHLLCRDSCLPAFGRSPRNARSFRGNSPLTCTSRENSKSFTKGVRGIFSPTVIDYLLGIYIPLSKILLRRGNRPFIFFAKGSAMRYPWLPTKRTYSTLWFKLSSSSRFAISADVSVSTHVFYSATCHL